MRVWFTQITCVLWTQYLIVLITWIPESNVGPFWKSLNQFLIRFPINWIYCSCALDFKVARLWKWAFLYFQSKRIKFYMSSNFNINFIYLSPNVDVVKSLLCVSTWYLVSNLWGATCPLIYQLRVAAGKELKEVQLAVRMSPLLYMGWVPLITGPSSGKSGIMWDFTVKYFIQSHSYQQQSEHL